MTATIGPAHAEDVVAVLRLDLNHLPTDALRDRWQTSLVVRDADRIVRGSGRSLIRGLRIGISALSSR
jgi:hypothetical protein